MSFRIMNVPSIVKFNSKLSLDFIESVESEIDRSILSRNGQPCHKTFAPSSFRCRRKNWFRLKGTIPDTIDVPDRNLEFFSNIGTSCHEMLQGYISNIDGIWYPVEHYIDDHPFPDTYKYVLSRSGYEVHVNLLEPYPIRFACDGILKFSNGDCLLEIKSASTAVFTELTDPKPEHLDQVKCYCTILGLSCVLFLYVDRTYGDMKCYEVKVTEADKAEVRKTFSDVMWAVEYDIAPEPLPKGDSWCSSNMCPYYKKCRSW